MAVKNKFETIAIDFGATNVRFAHFVNDDIANITVIPTPKSPDDFVNLATEQISKFGTQNVYAIGVGAAGYWDEECVLRQTLHLSEYLNYPVWTNLSARVNLPVFLKSDVELASMGEAIYGYGNRLESLMYINMGTGFSGGLFKNKEIFSTSYSPTLRLDYLVQPDFISGKSSKSSEGEDDTKDSQKQAKSVSLLASTLINLSFTLSPQVISIGGGKVNDDRWSKIIKPAINKAMIYLNHNLTYRIEIKRSALEYPTLYGAHELVKRYLPD